MSNVELIVVIAENVGRLALPSAVLVIFFSLRDEIKRLISRIVAIKWPGGVELRTEQQKPSKALPKVISPEAKREKIREIEKSSIQTADLVNQVATLRVVLHFERTYRLIFGSQIRLLERLERLGSLGQTYENIASTYQSERAVSATLYSYPLAHYLGFLENTGLIKTVGGTDRRAVKVTPVGVDFLEYIRAMKYPVKPLS